MSTSPSRSNSSLQPRRRSVHGWLRLFGPGLGRMGCLHLQTSRLLHLPLGPRHHGLLGLRLDRRPPSHEQCGRDQRDLPRPSLGSWRSPISHHCGPEAHQSPHDCVRLFGDNSIKPRCNKALIRRVRSLLTVVRRHHDQAISWVKAHSGLATPEAVGYANADRLAARGRTGSSGASEHPPPATLFTWTLVDACSAVPYPRAFSPLLPFRISPFRPRSGYTVSLNVSLVTIPAGSGDIVGE